MMSTVNNTFETVKAVIVSAHKSTTPREKVNFYDSWAENYDQVRKLLRNSKLLALFCVRRSVAEKLVKPSVLRISARPKSLNKDNWTSCVGS